MDNSPRKKKRARKISLTERERKVRFLEVLRSSRAKENGRNWLHGSRAGEDVSRLSEGFDLLTALFLDLVEILQHEIAGLVQLALVFVQRLEVLQRLALLGLSANEPCVALRGFLLLVCHGLNEGLDGCVRILKELFVRRRGIRLGTDRIGLSLLRLIDYGLDHPNDAVAAFVLVVLLEVLRRWRGLRARVRRRGGLGKDIVSSETFLAVNLLHAVEREHEDLLRRALVGDGLLELGVLRLPVLARAGHLELRVLDLSVGGCELLLQRVQGRRQGLDLGGQVRHGVLTEDSLLLVLVELRDAEVLLLHVVLLLLLELFHHLFNLLLDLLESLECDRRRHCDEHLAAGALRGRPVLRRDRSAETETCTKETVLLKSSWASSELRMAIVSATPCSSKFRAFDRDSNSASAFAQRTLRSAMNFWSAVRASCVSARFCFAAARSSSVCASSWVLESIIFLPEAISASLPALTCSKSATDCDSSFCASARFVSKVSFICSRIPKICPLAGA